MRVIAHDKALHMVAGVAASVLGMWMAVPMQSPYAAILFGFGACVFAAIAREAYNVAQDKPFDWLDIAYTFAGGLLALLAGFAVDVSDPL